MSEILNLPTETIAAAQDAAESWGLSLSTDPHEYLKTNAPSIFEALTSSEKPAEVAYLVGITNDALQLVAQTRNQELAQAAQQRQMEERQRQAEAHSQIALPVPVSRQVRRHMERSGR